MRDDEFAISQRGGVAHEFEAQAGRVGVSDQQSQHVAGAVDQGIWCRQVREAEELVGYQELAAKISKLKPKFVLSTGQGGKAFGSVTSIDIHKELETAGIVVDRHKILLDKPIKKSGKSEIEIKLNPQVTATLTITVDAGDVTEED